MAQMINPENWTPQEFKAFLLLYVANADLELKEDELDLASGELSDESFAAVRKYFTNCNDFQCIELIHAQRKLHFPGDDGKDLLIAEMTEVCRADGRMSSFEGGVINALKRLL